MTESAPTPRLVGAAKQSAIIKGRLDLHAKHILDLETELAQTREGFAHAVEQLAAHDSDPTNTTAQALAATGELPLPRPDTLYVGASISSGELLARRHAEEWGQDVPLFQRVRGEAPALAPPVTGPEKPEFMWDTRRGPLMTTTGGICHTQRSTVDPSVDPLGEGEACTSPSYGRPPIQTAR
jgi:hypothetical protein